MAAFFRVKFIALVVLALGAALTASAQDRSAQPITLPGVDVGELARCGNLKLFVPDGAANVSAEQAQATAEAADPFDLPVQQTVLARLVREPSELVYSDNLVWAVVLTDGAVHQWNGPGWSALENESLRKPLRYSYALVLVDALTGEFVMETFGPENPDYVASICPP